MHAYSMLERRQGNGALQISGILLKGDGCGVKAGEKTTARRTKVVENRSLPHNALQTAEAQPEYKTNAMRVALYFA
jgi:hypothetical protein